MTEFQRVLIINNNGIGNAVIALPSIALLARSMGNVSFWHLENVAFESKLISGALGFDGYRGSVPSIWRRFPCRHQDAMLTFMRERRINLLLNIRLSCPSEDSSFFLFRSRIEALGIRCWDLYQLGDVIFSQPVGASIWNLVNRGLGSLMTARPDLLWLSGVKPTEGRYDYPKTVAFFMGASQPKKRWPEERWAQLSQCVLQSTPYHLAFLPGSTDTELAAARRIEARVRKGFNHRMSLCVTMSLDQLITVLSRSQAVVTNDTVTSHLAASLGIPTVALYLVTASKIWRPLSRAPFCAVQSQRAIECSEMKMDGTCSRFYSECQVPCGNDVTPERVYAALADVLEVSRHPSELPHA